MDKNSWYTPEKYIDSVKRVFDIDLDPFSCSEANKTVNADRFYGCGGVSPDALSIDWDGVKTVFMNPPYSDGLYKPAIDKFIVELTINNFEAITLTHNNTETNATQKLLEHSNAICLTDHRINFYRKDGKSMSGTPRGQLFCYFGRKTGAFRDEFSKHGIVFIK